jgi:hypothetical protein
MQHGGYSQYKNDGRNVLHTCSMLPIGRAMSDSRKQ